MKTLPSHDAAPQFANPGKVTCAVLMIYRSSSTSDHAVFKHANKTDEEDDRPKCVRFAEGLQVMRDTLARDHWFSHSGELATVTFGATVSVNPFQKVGQWQPPSLEPEGQTPTGAALIAALDFQQPPMIVSQVSWIEVFVRLSQIVSRPMGQRPLVLPTTQG